VNVLQFKQVDGWMGGWVVDAPATARRVWEMRECEDEEMEGWGIGR
jgi:hypothetical protein